MMVMMGFTSPHHAQIILTLPNFRPFPPAPPGEGPESVGQRILSASMPSSVGQPGEPRYKKRFGVGQVSESHFGKNIPCQIQCRVFCPKSFIYNQIEPDLASFFFHSSSNPKKTTSTFSSQTWRASPGRCSSAAPAPGGRSL